MAEEYILSRDYVNRESEDDVATIKGIIRDRGLNAVWMVDPSAAAESVLEIFKYRKGIGKSNGQSRAQAGSALGGNAPVSNGIGQKIWTSKEISEMKMEDYVKFKDDIDTAKREGRVRD